MPYSEDFDSLLDIAAVMKQLTKIQGQWMNREILLHAGTQIGNI